MGADPRRATVAAVMVVFRPAPGEPGPALAAIAPQVEWVIAVENGPDSTLDPALTAAHPRLVVLRMPGNLGLAAAQNAGVRRAQEAGASHVLLLDQDSEPAPDMVARLLDADRRLADSGVPIAALGPAWLDPRTGVAGPLPRFSWGLERVSPPLPGLDEVDCLIASGSLIACRTLDQVGPFDEALFVYHVDTDWILRARARGLRPFQVRDATMKHRIGDGLVRWWFFGPRVGILYRPAPWYFILRNSLLVLRKGFAPLSWSLRELVRLPFLAAFALGHARQRSATLGAILRGIRDGLCGRSGPGEPEAGP